MSGRSLAVRVVVLALLGSGCRIAALETAPPAPGTLARGRGALDAATLLLGAAEGEDLGPGLEPGERKGAGLVARAGFFVPGAADAGVEFESGFLVGAAYDLPFLSKGPLAVEVGADFTRVSDADDLVESALVILSSAARFSTGDGGFYFAGTGSVMLESVEKESGVTYSNTLATVGGGAGYRPRGGKFDARFTYSRLIGSDNVAGIVSLTGGYVF